MKKWFCLVLAMLLCAGSALADVVIPELPGGVDEYTVRDKNGYTEYYALTMKTTCTKEELEDFVEELEDRGFRNTGNTGNDHIREFTYSGKGASGLHAMKGLFTKKDVHIYIDAAFSIKIRVADGITMEGMADAESSATETVKAEEMPKKSENGLELRRFSVVVEIDGKSELYTVETDEEYVLNALLVEGLIDGEDIALNTFYVTTVAGVEADYEGKGEYWYILEFNKKSGQFEPLKDSLNGKLIEDGVGYAFVLVD